MTLSRPEPTLTGGDFQCRHCRLLADSSPMLLATPGQKRPVMVNRNRLKANINNQAGELPEA